MDCLRSAPSRPRYSQATYPEIVKKRTSLLPENSKVRIFACCIPIIGELIARQSLGSLGKKEELLRKYTTEGRFSKIAILQVQEKYLYANLARKVIGVACAIFLGLPLVGIIYLAFAIDQKHRLTLQQAVLKECISIQMARLDVLDQDAEHKQRVKAEARSSLDDDDDDDVDSVDDNDNDDDRI